MGQITYKINSGYPNFTAHIEPNVAADQVHSSTGTYSFTDIPVGDYSITITDGIGCEAFIDNIHITTTTTTTTTTTIQSTIDFGILYNKYTVEDSRNLLVEGWHVLSKSEWVTLLIELGGSLIFDSGVIQ